MKVCLLESSIIFLLVAQTLLVSGVSARSLQPQPSDLADIPTAQTTGAFILQRGSHWSVQLSISETSYFTYHVRSNTSISTALATPGQLRRANQTAGITEVVYEQNGSLIRNAALLTPGGYYLVFQARHSGADIKYSYTISPATTRNATTYFGETLVLQPRHTYSIHLNYETLGSPSTLTLFGISNQSVYYTIYDASSNSVVFRSPLVTATNATSDIDIAKGTYTVTLPPAMYILHVTNPHLEACMLRVEYQISPSYVNPYLAIIGRGLTGYPKSLATGLSSFGLYNQSGEITPYEIRTNKLVGFANISSISAYNPKPPAGVGTADASLQLNAVLVIKNRDGSRYEYWIQNVFAFQTDSRRVRAAVTVVNITGLGAYLNDHTIQGRGEVAIPPAKSGTSGNYYTSEGAPVSYELPFIFSVSLEESIRENRDVWIAVRASEFQRGAERMNTNTTIDDVLIKDRNASEAYFLISGKEYAPPTSSVFRDQPGLFYDAELVFAGGGNGEVTTFNSLEANLRLIFFNQTTHSFQLFPSYYGFGTNTFEATDNQKVRFDGQFATMVSGAPDYAYLGSSSNIPQSILLPKLEGSASQGSEILPWFIAVGVATVVLLIAGVQLSRRRRKRSSAKPSK